MDSRELKTVWLHLIDDGTKKREKKANSSSVGMRNVTLENKEW